MICMGCQILYVLQFKYSTNATNHMSKAKVFCQEGMDSLWNHQWCCRWWRHVTRELLLIKVSASAVKGSGGRWWCSAWMKRTVTNLHFVSNSLCSVRLEMEQLFLQIVAVPLLSPQWQPTATAMFFWSPMFEIRLSCHMAMWCSVIDLCDVTWRHDFKQGIWNFNF